MRDFGLRMADWGLGIGEWIHPFETIDISRSVLNILQDKSLSVKLDIARRFHELMS